MVHRDELRPVRERSFHLHFRDQLRHAIHDLGAPEQPAAEVHQLGDAAAVADELEQLGGDQRDRLRMVEAEPAREALLGQMAHAVKQQLVDFAGDEVHGLPRSGPPGPRIVAEQLGKECEV